MYSGVARSRAAVMSFVGAGGGGMLLRGKRVVVLSCICWRYVQLYRGWLERGPRMLFVFWNQELARVYSLLTPSAYVVLIAFMWSKSRIAFLGRSACMRWSCRHRFDSSSLSYLSQNSSWSRYFVPHTRHPLHPGLILDHFSGRQRAPTFFQRQCTKRARLETFGFQRCPLMRRLLSGVCCFRFFGILGDRADCSQNDLALTCNPFWVFLSPPC